jgi:protein-disulfide isomerase
MSNEAKILTGIGLLTLVVVVAAAMIFGGNTPASAKKVLGATDQKILVRPDSHEIAVKGAKVTLVEFGDFECPACGEEYPIVTKLLQAYTGKVNFVFREFPIPSHKYGNLAAQAAEAAGGQGKFFEMFNKLYSNQKDWGDETKDTNAMDYFVKYAEELKLDVTKFKSDTQNNTYKARIIQDQTDATSLNVNATPTFFLNGEEIVGGLSYNDFKAKIDSALKG